MKIKIRDNFVHWTTLRDGTKVMYGVRMKDLAQAVKVCCSTNAHLVSLASDS